MHPTQLLSQVNLIILQIMATAWVGARDQTNPTLGKPTMKRCCERKTSDLALYAKGLLQDKIRLLVSDLQY